jgi:hypothetical protein
VHKFKERRTSELQVRTATAGSAAAEQIKQHMAATWQQPRISEIYPNRKPFMDDNGKRKDLRVRN